MSPPKFQDAEVTKGSINGPRLSPLKITRESHIIHKSSQQLDNPPSHKHNLSAKRQPVIIYTHSPKVIHAQARDFMTLVQKLTGLTQSDDEKIAAGTTVESKKDEKASVEEDVSCVGGGSEEKESGGLLREIKPDPSANLCLIDQDTSNDFFYPSRGSSMFQSSKQLGYMGYMKEFSEYK